MAPRHLVGEAELLAAIVEGSDDAILTIGLDGTILAANLAALRRYGYREDELVGQAIDLLCTPLGALMMRKHIAEATTARTTDAFEAQRITKSGEVIEVSLSTSQLRDESGSVVGVASIARDITSL